LVPEKGHLKILLAEDDPVIREILPRFLSLSGFNRVTPTADGRAAKRCIEAEEYDLLITDVEMPLLRGDELLGIARERDPNIKVIVLSGAMDDDLRAILRRLGARACFRKPLPRREFMGEIEQIFREIAGEVLAADERAILPLVEECEKLDPFSGGRQRKVADLAMETALAMNLSLRRMVSARLGGLSADVGKLKLDPRVLGKETPLSDDELFQIRCHTLHSVEILDPILKSRESLHAVAQHHESMDGSGYPHGLTGDRIRVEAQIVSLADAFDAMSSPRPFRKAMDPEEVHGRIIEGRGSRWFPGVVDAFLTQVYPV
jgi:putative two-component system response regulator